MDEILFRGIKFLLVHFSYAIIFPYGHTCLDGIDPLFKVFLLYSQIALLVDYLSWMFITHTCTLMDIGSLALCSHVI